MTPLLHNSLRWRYAAVATTLTLLVLMSAYFTNRNVTGARQATTLNIEIRNELLQHSRHVRDNVWQARESLNAFLLHPENTQHKGRVHAAIGRAVEYARTLASHPWIIGNGHRETIDILESSLESLDRGVAHLIETRTDATRQYPALELARSAMLPEHRAFYTAAQLAMEEIVLEDRNEIHSRAYQAFVQARHMWTRMISTFRMYLANRLGSFAEESLPVQKRDIELQYKELLRQLELLEEMKQSGQLGFQGGISLHKLEASANSWHRAFRKVQQIHESGQWRSDTRLIKQRIRPPLENIWQALLSLDASIEQSAAHDVKTLTRVAQNQSRILWIVTAVGVIFIALGYIALEQWILRPIGTVVEGLKAESLGADQGESLPRATSRETRALVEAFSEMRQQVHNRQVALEHQATHDALTDLPNRNLLMDRLQQAIHQARRDNACLALVMMDLDRFKEINDTLGHHVGDWLLQQVGKRLFALLRDSDTVARLGGDEFALLLPGTQTHQAKQIANKIFNALERVFVVDTHQLYVGASIGIATYPQHGASAQTLIQRADVAMYVAKRNKISYAIYDPRQDQHSVGRLAMTSDLRKALDKDELVLHYQPKLELATGRVVGAEALLRWHHPQYGRIPPDEVVSLAERTGLIRPLTLWVLDQAVAQAAGWRKQGLDLSVAVNLSVYNLQDLELLDQVRRRLTEHGVPAHYLSLEITESAMMSDPHHALRTLEELDNMGVHLSIDDFGTGFSSLAYLKQLPVDELKIDKSFVMDMYQDENDAVIVRSTIDLAHNLGLRVIAEGVESKEVWDILQILRCDEAQGYFMSQPLPAQALEKWLRDHDAIQATG